MTTQQETKYKVQSLERGLAILRELRAANAPVRNQELVKRTRLPKATVSRLLNTLGALGYVRRIDQGSYVLAHASARSGRAMLGALSLERYRALFADAPGPVYLEAIAGGRLVPVYRWARTCACAMANGCPAELGPTGRQLDWGDGEHWDAAAGMWWTWTTLNIQAVGSFALTVQVSQQSAPTRQQVDQARLMLLQAARAMTLERYQ